MPQIADKKDRVVAARMQLLERYRRRIDESPSIADGKPLGTGASNRHGMPKLPVGQVATKKWPVLDLGIHPEVPKESWQLTLDGACRRPTTLSFEDFSQLPQVRDTSDFHCVTTWSRMDLAWVGVRFVELAAMVEPLPEAGHVMCYAYDDYTTNVRLEEALKPDVLLVHSVDGRALPKEHGGPVRMITPQLYAWKGAKWIRRIEFLTEERLGFWEQRGYSSTAYPWRDDRTT